MNHANDRSLCIYWATETQNLMTGVSRQDLISVRLNDCCSILPLTGELGIGWTALHHTAVL
ncbi:hypothetical protein SLT67_21030 [Paenibacillus illinoisensis]|uniref:hypothetical protein n=1 Tax=Paenibacillus illinoisensis TaxID=59845 RepID=UPI003CEE4421